MTNKELTAYWENVLDAQKAVRDYYLGNFPLGVGIWDLKELRDFAEREWESVTKAHYKDYVRWYLSQG